MLRKSLNRAATGLLATAIAAFAAAAIAQTPPASTSHVLTLQTDQSGPTINRDIFGQFSEHIGEGIYGGIWVGKNSKIPNVRGIRSDVVGALRAIKVPVVRWPGGCFADRYHWRNGIGPAAKRPPTFNALWGHVIEPNTFGTDEYMDFLSQIGAEAYISVNVGTGSVQEASDWLEYMTIDKPTVLGKERAANGHPKPYKIKYMGMGNEMWGCGGVMTADDYVEYMKRYALLVESQNPDQINTSMFQRSPHAMQRVAVGDAGNRNDFTEAVMKARAEREPWYWNIEGLSIHHYTFGGSIGGNTATGFGEQDYASLLKETLTMDGFISRRTAIMDKYDPKKEVALVVDEWGAMTKPDKNNKPLNSLRDAITTSLNFDIFARHADRLRMTNISMTVNVGQTMVVTDGAKMLLTPTYYVYKMYTPFQDAKVIPIALDAGQYTFGSNTLPQVDGIAARGTDGNIWIALTNLDPNQAVDVTPNLKGVSPKSATGEVLTGDKVDSSDTFDAPYVVAPKPFSAQAAGGNLVLHLPPKSVTVVRLEQ